MKALHVVIPNGVWVTWASANLRGSPAIHVTEAGSDKTLCGKMCVGWDAEDWNGQDQSNQVNCTGCLRKLRKGEEQER